MRANDSLYTRYRSTTALVPGVDEKALLEWSCGYFAATYRKFLPSDRTARILDVGCGYGRYLYALRRMGFTDCYGIDISGEQVAYAVSTLGLANVEHADALVWLDARRGTYDAILALDLLEHLPTDDLLALGRTMRDALKPGGRLIVQVPNAMAPLNPVTYGDLTHVRAFTVESLRQLFLAVGLVPGGFHEIPPYVHGALSAVRRAAWHAVVRPSLHLFVSLVHGKVPARIYSANMIGVASRVDA